MLNITMVKALLSGIASNAFCDDLGRNLQLKIAFTLLTH